MNENLCHFHDFCGNVTEPNMSMCPSCIERENWREAVYEFDEFYGKKVEVHMDGLRGRIHGGQYDGYLIHNFNGRIEILMPMNWVAVMSGGEKEDIKRFEEWLNL